MIDSGKLANTRVLSSVTDPRMGGPQRRSLGVAKRLRQRGIETVFLIPKGENSFAKKAEEEGFETYRVTFSRLRPPTEARGNMRFFVHFVPTVREIASIIRNESINVVHTNMVVNFQTALATTRTEARLAWHFNDTLTPSPVKQLASHAAVRWADEIVVAADAVHDYYFSPETPSQTIYAPVDVEQFDPERISVEQSTLRAELGLKQDIPIVGTVGNINPIKGHEYLLQAAAELLQDGKEIAVPIVGSKLDSRKQYFETLCTLREELGLEDQVKFVGFRSDVPELLYLFDVFVLPSVAEACPMAVLEAMAMKCPVVATDVGGVSEEIPNQDYGWVVPPQDSNALAEAIDDALENPSERHRRGANARNRAVTMFSLGACVDRHEKLYRSLARVE